MWVRDSELDSSLSYLLEVLELMVFTRQDMGNGHSTLSCIASSILTNVFSD
jgi:hypothetical protein